MPRISRNTVQFQVDGQSIFAIFRHQHCVEDPKLGVMVKVPEKDGHLVTRVVSKVLKPLVDGKFRVRHRTECELVTVTGQSLGKGVVRCSIKDNYCWRKGNKLALEQAILNGGLSDIRGKILHGYYSELPYRPGQARPEPKAHKVSRKKVA